MSPMKSLLIKNVRNVLCLLLDYTDISTQSMVNRNGFPLDGIVIDANMFGWIKKLKKNNYAVFVFSGLISSLFVI